MDLFTQLNEPRAIHWPSLTWRSRCLCDLMLLANGIRKLLHQLADAETVLHHRPKRIISGPSQVIWAFDQDAWEQQVEYDKMPLHQNKAIDSSVRESVIYLAEQFYESKGTTTFVHSESGLRTLKDEFDKIASHNAHHLQQIKTALAN